jgi:hypothetical protein
MTELRAADTVNREETGRDTERNPGGSGMSTADFLAAGSSQTSTDTGTVTEQRPRGDDADVPLFQPDAADSFRSRWTDIQAAFVDDPRQAVERADGLVAETMKQLAQMFADERANLEQQWQQGEDISTEDLRQALQRYRSFFDRLLSV